jgi:hypothetical protein
MSACFEHSNFFTVNDLGPRDRTPVFDRRRAAPCDVPTNSMAGTGIQKEGTGGPVDTLVLQRTEPATPTRRRFDPTTRDACECASLDPTTSFLTATTLIYAIGAGITAAAGTRLALQLFLVKGFKLYSFQLQGPKEPCISISCHCLPVSGLGNLRACCLPWMWKPFLRLPLRNQTLISRYPLRPW